MTKTLTIRTRAGRKIAKLVWRDGTVIVECDPGVGLDVAHWVRDGIGEWIYTRDELGESAVARHTPAHDQMFLARLAAHLQSRFGFQTLLEDGG